MRIVYDTESDAAYVYLKDPIRPGESVRTVVCDIDLESASIHLDFGAKGHLLGIEVLGASRVLPEEALAEARSQQ